MPSQTIPADPLARLLELSPALAAEKRWFHDWSMLRFAAVGLLCVPGDEREIVRRLFTRAEELKACLPWYSSLKSDVRFCTAAGLLRLGVDGRRFLHVLKATREHFRAQKLPRGEVEEALATLVLMHEAPDRLPDESRVRRLASCYAGMKQHHPFLTGRDDLATAALLSGTEASVEDVIKRVEGIYSALRRSSFGAGNPLQLASHLLYFAASSEGTVARRFREIYTAFKDQGLWMGSDDYDEVALLTCCDGDPGRLARSVVAARGRLRESLSPRPSKQEGFTLATSAVFLQAAADSPDLVRMHNLQQLANLAGVVSAQQAAVVAAAAGAAAAAG